MTYLLDMVDRRWWRLLVISGAVIASYYALAILLSVLARFSEVLLIVLFASLFAYLASPLVDALQKRGLPRWAAVVAVYVATLALLIVLAVLIAAPLMNQASALATQLRQLLGEGRGAAASLDTWLRDHGMGGGQVQSYLVGAFTSVATQALGELPNVASAVASLLIGVVSVTLISFLLLLGGPELREGFYRVIPVRYHARSAFFEAAFAQIVGGYLRGQLLVAIIIGTGVAGLTTLTGVRFSLLLGFLAGVLELVPMLGPFLAAAPALAVALSQSTAQALLVAVGFFVIQQVEANVLAPRITGRAVGLPAAAALIAMLVGVSLGGLLGALFAIPAAGFGNAVLRAWYRKEVSAGYQPVDTPAPPDVDVHAAELPTVGERVAEPRPQRSSVHGRRERAARRSAKPEGG